MALARPCACIRLLGASCDPNTYYCCSAANMLLVSLCNEYALPSRCRCLEGDFAYFSAAAMGDNYGLNAKGRLRAGRPVGGRVEVIICNWWVQCCSHTLPSLERADALDARQPNLWLRAHRRGLPCATGRCAARWPLLLNTQLPVSASLRR